MKAPLVTGIGSLPHTDAGQAMEFVAKTTPRAPYWPQLPRRTPNEGMIRQFEVLMPNRGFPAPTAEVYAATEAPNGELGFYVVGDGSTKPYRARCRPPSFVHFAAFPHMIRGYTLSDVVAVLGSLNIIAAELDR